jgi:mono/diheme cytochrome c family protein
MILISKIIIAVAGVTFVFPMLAFAADSPNGHSEYERNCMMCHGVTGRGNGWLAEYLKQPVPSLTQLKKKNGGVFPVEHLHQVIDGRKEFGLHGPRRMLAWGQVYLTRAQRELGLSSDAYDADEIVLAKISALINYISTLQE